MVGVLLLLSLEQAHSPTAKPSAIPKAAGLFTKSLRAPEVGQEAITLAEGGTSVDSTKRVRG
jgi:hypothetical protein